MSKDCPVCHKPIEDVKAVRCDGKVFTAKDAFEGLEAWGAYSVPKEIVCQNETWVHMRFIHSGDERLVEMKPFNLEKIRHIQEHHAEHPQTCEHEGCEKDGKPGYFGQFDEEPMGWYCEDHAHDNGFCPSCMMFGAGREDFDFSRTGLCGACTQELADELGDGDRYDDDEMYEVGYEDYE